METGSIKNFSDFNIPIKRSFEGPSICVEDILEQPIIVHFYEVMPSKKKGKEGTDWLHVQITFENKKRLLWSGSTYLIDALRNIPAAGFAFRAKIVRVNRHFEFRGLDN